MNQAINRRLASFTQVGLDNANFQAAGSNWQRSSEHLHFRHGSLKPETQAKIDRSAAESGYTAQQFAADLIERYVDYDAWFEQEIEKGLAAADRGEFVEHEEIGRLINSRYPS